jgi:peptide/nickel transport system permease protein
MKAHAQRLIAARLGLALLTLLLVSAIVFGVTGLLPGDAAQQALGQAATPEAVAALRHQFGLDQPALQRYLEWLLHIVTGNFGTSMSNNLPVSQLIATRLPNSLVLAGLTAVVSVPVALAIGIA